ncbi:MAG: toxic anion resistance protein [Oscillospiraceae bacterium]|nr:toxic anion resistance protein [Oscillospiraceae bacterium]
MANEFELDEFRPYDISAERQIITESLAGTDELDAVVSTLDVADLNTITSFGKRAAEQVAQASDAVLKNVSMNQISESSDVMNELAKLMSKINIGEIQAEAKGIMGKFFGNTEKQADRIYEKYRVIGEETDKIFIRLKQYEAKIADSNRNLNRMFEANTAYYRELVKYIAAGEQGCREIEDYLNELKDEFAKTGDKLLFPEMENLENALMLLQNRTNDLKIAESIAIQSVPMIKAMELSNSNLMKKINTAFLVTLPIFNQSLSQAVSVKRQTLENKAMAALNRRMEEEILANARDNVHREQLEQRLNAGAQGKNTKLSELHSAIVGSIDEFKKLQNNAAKQRIDYQTALVRAMARFDGINKKA